MTNVFDGLFRSRISFYKEKQLGELHKYLIAVDNHFFERSVVIHKLNPDHRKTLLVTLRLFYPGKDYNKSTNRHYVYNFIARWHRYSNKEMQEYCEKYSLADLIENFNDLPQQSKITIMLLINCILYIDENATEQQKKMAQSIYKMMEITPQLYANLMKEFDEIAKDKWFSYIHSHPF